MKNAHLPRFPHPSSLRRTLPSTLRLTFPWSSGFRGPCIWAFLSSPRKTTFSATVRVQSLHRLDSSMFSPEFIRGVSRLLRYLFLLIFFAEDLQHKSFSRSVSEESSDNEYHADQSDNPSQNPFNGKGEKDQNNSYDRAQNCLYPSDILCLDHGFHIVPPCFFPFFALLSRFFIRPQRFSTLGLGPLLSESLQNLLLLPNRKVRVGRVAFSISLFNESNRITGSDGLCADHLTLPRSPTGFDRILWRR